jgi:tRNA(Ile)-lysidine synthase
MDELLTPRAMLDRERWPSMAAAAGVDPREPLVLGFSGGADSRLLLHWLSVSDPRPRVIAVHVHHGLRGRASDLDAAFCAETCRAAGVELRVRRATLDPRPEGLEQRAREARYRILVREARLARVRWIVTAHQADDSFETTLMRWLRGSELSGLRGIEAATREARGSVGLLRPLLGLRREEVRALAQRAGLRWREDASNHDARFARARVREKLLPALERAGGTTAVEGLRAFADAVGELEQRLAARTADLRWTPLPGRAATRRPEHALLGGSVRRRALTALPPLLRRRALARLLVDATAHAPGRRLLDRLESALDEAARGRWTLRGGWRLALRSEVLELHPPVARLVPRPQPAELPFDPPVSAATSPHAQLERSLSVPGVVHHDDGRRIAATRVDGGAEHPVPRGPTAVELALPTSVDRLTVRAPRPGDRVQLLGAPGHRSVARILADARVPRGERALVPLVLWRDEIVWVAGLRPAEKVRVIAPNQARVRLELVGGARPAAPAPRRAPRAHHLQAEFDFTRRSASES